MKKEIKKQEESKGFGIASLVTSIIGFFSFLMPYFGVVWSILAIVFAGLQKKKQDTGLATAGLVIGILGLIGNLIWLIFVIIGYMAIGGMY